MGKPFISIGHEPDPDFGTPLDPGIERAVRLLREAGVETFESCEGGTGHGYYEPTIRFHGQREEGYRAYAVAASYGLPVRAIRRIWPVQHGELTGPWWEMTFSHHGLTRDAT